MPSPELEAAEMLMAAAAKDELVVRELLDNPRLGDAVIGFHAQQAIEKLLKAVLASRGIDYLFTHSIARLLDQLGRDEMPKGLPLGEATDLTPWAIELRYGVGSASELDRRAALRLIEAFRAWAEAEIHRS